MTLRSFPYGKIDRVAGVEHYASGGYIYQASHWLRIDHVIGEVKMPDEADKRTIGRLSIYRHVNLTVLRFSSLSHISQMVSVIRIGARTSES